MSTPLFRPEVMQAQTAQFHGGFRIGRNPRFDLVALVALLLAAALVSFAIWGEITRKARIPGILVPSAGLLQVSSPATGALLERRVEEGEFVHAGQVLFVVGTDRLGAQGDTAVLVAHTLKQRRQTLEVERGIRQEQARQRQRSLADRLRALDREATQAETEVALTTQRSELAHKTVERYRQLAANGFVSDIQAQNKQEEQLDAQGRHQATQRAAAAIQREGTLLRAELAAVGTQLKSELTQIERALAQLSQDDTENDARRQTLVTAQQAGIVTALHVAQGAIVLPGQSLATLVPQVRADVPSPLRAELYGPSRATGFVQPGQVVWLRYAAYPYQKFGMARGVVSSVSRTPVNPQDLPLGQGNALMAAASVTEPLYRVVVALTQQHLSAGLTTLRLSPGIALDADVMRESRAVWEWVLEPLLTVTRRSGSLRV